MKLMIVESPNKIKKIKKIVGEGWLISASVGHIRDLPKHEIGVASPDFVPEYIVTDDKKKVVNNLKSAFKQCDEVYLATDSDREGEAIAYHIEQVLGLEKSNKPYCRISFNAINAKAIKEAIANKGQINHQYVASQETRRIIDRLVGYMVSPVLGRGLSAGRVQSPSIRLIVERDNEIKNFQPKTHYAVTANISNDAIKWKMNWDFSTLLEKSNKENIWLDKNIADQVAKTKILEIIDVDKKQVSQKAPAPFETSSLQQAAGRVLGFGAEKTMSLAQSLYAAGHISYHRTDNPNPSDESITELQSYLQAKDLPCASKINKWSSSGDAQEAHEAIRPVDINVSELQESDCDGKALPDQVKLYHLIYERFFCCQMPDAIYDTKTIKAKSTDVVLENDVIPLFKITGKTLKKENPSWMTYLKSDANDDESEEDHQDFQLPDIQTGDIKSCDCDTQERQTQPPPHYTEATLIKKLKALGIGRPSTYASIIGRIKKAGYVTLNGRKMIASEKAHKVIQSLCNTSLSFINYDYTVEMEKNLDKIASSNATYKETVASVFNDLNSELGSVKAVGDTEAQPVTEVEFCSCDLCGGTVFNVKSKNERYQCKDCNAVVWKKSFGRTIKQNEVKQLFSGESVLLMNLVSKNSGNKYDATGKITDGKLEISFDNEKKLVGLCKCKEAGGIEYGGREYSCVKCKKNMVSEQLNHKFTPEEASELLAGNTLYIEGLKSNKKGAKKFGCDVNLNSDRAPWVSLTFNTASLP